MADLTIYLERVVDREGEYGGYDPAAPYARPTFYAHIMQDSSDIPSEFEVRLSSYKGEEGAMMTITPRQLNEEGDLYFPVEALMTAIRKIEQRTEENHRARAAQVSRPIEGDAEEVGDEART